MNYLWKTGSWRRDITFSEFRAERTIFLCLVGWAEAYLLCVYCPSPEHKCQDIAGIWRENIFSIRRLLLPISNIFLGGGKQCFHRHSITITCGLQNPPPLSSPPPCLMSILLSVCATHGARDGTIMFPMWGSHCQSPWTFDWQPPVCHPNLRYYEHQEMMGRQQMVAIIQLASSHFQSFIRLCPFFCLLHGSVYLGPW
jgi:hypothetical protein